ncbi:hypothetical protein L3Y34_004896 [Caenorhabditis briggsae]|uniref:Uncharacterized protein n=1 Tax=Caenorhabditis briggsae TaxID=6238 RepID=A0AAE9D5C4_CAEBR|nr:hypothetical protein L3Y34_004896 [Caenorhabditis briggsae]
MEGHKTGGLFGRKWRGGCGDGRRNGTSCLHSLVLSKLSHGVPAQQNKSRIADEETKNDNKEENEKQQNVLARLPAVRRRRRQRRRHQKQKKKGNQDLKW